MKKLLLSIGILIPLLLPRIAFAASNPEVDHFASDAMTAILALAGTAVVFFLVRGGYLYITSSGDPSALEDAKRTIKNALIGLVIVIAAAFMSNLLSFHIGMYFCWFPFFFHKIFFSEMLAA